jgi:hypothetical protein
MYRQRRRGAHDAYMVLLLAQLVQRIAQLEHKPPVTLGIVGGEALLLLPLPLLLLLLLLLL